MKKRKKKYTKKDRSLIERANMIREIEGNIGWVKIDPDEAESEEAYVYLRNMVRNMRLNEEHSHGDL